MKKNILGIDIRSNVVKVAEIRKNTKGAILEKWGSVSIPLSISEAHPDNEKALSKALIEIMRSRKIRTKKAVVIVSGADVLVKNISLPQMPQSEIRQAARFKAEKFISYPIDDAVFDFYPTKDNQYVIAIAKKEIIIRILNICQTAGIRVQSISIIPVALQAAFFNLLADEIISIIYMGQYSTNICIFKGKEFVFTRDVAIGGETITRAMAGVVASEKGKIELNAEEAEKLKLKEGLPINFEEYSQRTGIPANDLAAMMRPALEKIEAEIMRSFEYFGSPVSKIILTGGSSETKGLIEILANALKIGIEKGRPPIITKHVDIPLTPLAVAIGGAIEEGRKINLLTEDYKHPIKKIITKIANFWTAGTIFGFILISIFVWYFYKNTVLSSKISVLRKEASSLGITFSGDQTIEKDDYAYLANFNPPGQKDIFIQIINEFDKLAPVNISLDKIRYDFTARSIIIDGIYKKTGSEDSITFFMQKLKKGRLFASVDLSSLRESPSLRTEAYEFEIKCAVVRGINK